MTIEDFINISSVSFSGVLEFMKNTWTNLFMKYPLIMAVVGLAIIGIIVRILIKIKHIGG